MEERAASEWSSDPSDRPLGLSELREFRPRARAEIEWSGELAQLGVPRRHGTGRSTTYGVRGLEI